MVMNFVADELCNLEHNANVISLSHRSKKAYEVNEKNHDK